jgi:hypothetical protein
MENNKSLKFSVLVIFGIIIFVSLSISLMAQSWGTTVQEDASYRIIIDDDDNASDEVFAVWHDGTGGSELFRIQENGNVGIGTISPDTSLDIEEQGTVKSNLEILHLTNSANAVDMDGTETSILFSQYYYDISNPVAGVAGRITVGTETDWTSLPSSEDSYMAFATLEDTNLNERMRITSSGNVGIGTTSPDTELHVNGDIKQKITTSNVANPPTDAELDTLFGLPASKGDGWTAYVKDSSSANFYQVVAVGTSWYTFTAVLAV